MGLFGGLTRFFLRQPSVGVVGAAPSRSGLKRYRSDGILRAATDEQTIAVLERFGDGLNHDDIVDDLPPELALSKPTVRRIIKRLETKVMRLAGDGYELAEIVDATEAPEEAVVRILERAKRAATETAAAGGALGPLAQMRETLRGVREINQELNSTAAPTAPAPNGYGDDPRDLLEQEEANLELEVLRTDPEVRRAARTRILERRGIGLSNDPLKGLQERLLATALNRLENPGASDSSADDPLLVQGARALFPNGINDLASAVLADRAQERALRVAEYNLRAAEFEARQRALTPALPEASTPIPPAQIPTASSAPQPPAQPVTVQSEAGGLRIDESQSHLLLGVFTPEDIGRLLEIDDPRSAAAYAMETFDARTDDLSPEDRAEAEHDLDLLIDGGPASMAMSMRFMGYTEWATTLRLLSARTEWLGQFRERLGELAGRPGAPNEEEEEEDEDEVPDLGI